MTAYYDNTRISAYKRCPRHFYFRHIRHWQREGTKAALVFGGSWHSAMDVVWGLGKDGTKTDSDIVDIAMAAFLENWTSEGLPWPMSIEAIEEFSPRTPQVAMEMLFAYVKERRPFLKTIDLLSIERPFCVALTDSRDGVYYVGRLDKEFRHPQYGVLVGEHKTTSLYRKEGNFEAKYLDGFSFNSQVDGYSHAIHMDHGKDANGVWIDVALVHKKVHDAFKFVPIQRKTQAMDAWLQDTNSWVGSIELDTYLLYEERHQDRPLPVMQSFRRNTEGCQGKYNDLCPYFDMCRFWNNPEAHKEVPDGFQEVPWKPFDVLHLEKLGLTKE